MATNERVEWKLDDKTYYLQDAPSQEERTDFTPGKAGNALGGGITPASARKFRMNSPENWPVDFPVKVGVPAADDAGLMHGLLHTRVTLTHRQTVCDQVLSSSIPVSGNEPDAYENLAGRERSTGEENIWR